MGFINQRPPPASYGRRRTGGGRPGVTPEFSAEQPGDEVMRSVAKPRLMTVAPLSALYVIYLSERVGMAKGENDALTFSPVLLTTAILLLARRTAKDVFAIVLLLRGALQKAPLNHFSQKYIIGIYKTLCCRTSNQRNQARFSGL